MFVVLIKFVIGLVVSVLTSMNSVELNSFEKDLAKKLEISVGTVLNTGNISSIPRVHRRSVFHVKQNPNEKYIVEGIEKPAVNKTRLSPRPSFALSKNIPLTLDPKVFRCIEETAPSCRNKTQTFRNKILNEFKKSNFNPNETNYYNVDFQYGTINYDLKYLPSTCLIMNLVKVLKRKDSRLKNIPLAKIFPRRKIFNNMKNVKNCAIVSSAGSLFKSNMGEFIDHHDIVMRFNHAPIEGFESDVGIKTNIRVVNSQVVTKPEFNFTESNIFHNITIAAWDPGKYNGTLNDWFNNADFNLFTNYEKYKKKFPKSDAYLIDPQSIWRLWKSLQIFSGIPIRKNPPSSGFIGLALLLPYCPYVDFIEYIPSTRLNGKCHYYSKEMNSACTFGVWHPLSAEKLMALDMNIADDFTVFQDGVIRVRRPDPLLCDSIRSLLRF